MAQAMERRNFQREAPSQGADASAASSGPLLQEEDANECVRTLPSTNVSMTSKYEL